MSREVVLQVVIVNEEGRDVLTTKRLPMDNVPGEVHTMQLKAVYKQRMASRDLGPNFRLMVSIDDVNFQFARFSINDGNPCYCKDFHDEDFQYFLTYGKIREKESTENKDNPLAGLADNI